ncbi:hypothetical protein EV140_1906 [Microcella alkaliphila]|uniref:Uncharacterized protein n=1 Tax=Microcella alkaliphila TaxID=279828 RepID=A0A0U5BAI3_9MICO|nr:hypothetical protein [Microcella alkaliphila]RZT59302.1 hypothetical protein EV140_1906 [Microcella alkaliphila]BAU32768.1 uncharacterized protein MalAC0309_1921 [Microcella alkaliphila]
MQWGNDLLTWLATDDGQRVLFSSVVPAVAIVVAGIIAALIGRAASKRVIAQYQRDALTAAVQGLVLAGRKAAGWNAIGTIERVQVDHLIAEAETRIRLLPVPGAALAANWSAHQLEDMKRNSAGFSFQAQQLLAEYRDRLIAWNEKPRRAKKLFGADLERWKYEADPEEQKLVAEQVEWERGHTQAEHEKTVAAPAVVTPAPATPESEPAEASNSEAVALAFAPPPAVVPSAPSDDAPAPKPASAVRERIEGDENS